MPAQIAPYDRAKLLINFRENIFGTMLIFHEPPLFLKFQIIDYSNIVLQYCNIVSMMWTNNRTSTSVEEGSGLSVIYRRPTSGIPIEPRQSEKAES